MVILLLKEALRGISKNLKKYLSLFLFLFLTVSIFSALITTTVQNNNSIVELEKSSTKYDYEINSSLLTLKYNNETQENLSKSSSEDEEYLGDILSRFNYYEKDSDEYNNYTFYQLHTDLSKCSIYRDGTDWKINLPSNIKNIISEETKKIWLKAIVEYPSVSINVNTSTSYYIAVDGLNNYIIWDLLKNNQSPVFKNLLHSEISNISYVHHFYLTQEMNSKKMYFAFENTNYNSWSEQNTINQFYTRNIINKVVTVNNEVNASLNNGELFLNKQFAYYNKFNLGQDITFSNGDTSQTFKINNFASSVSDLYPITQDISSFYSDLNKKGLKDGSYIILNNDDFSLLDKDLANNPGSKNNSNTTIYLSLPFNLNQYDKDEVLSGEGGLFSSYFINKSNLFNPYDISPNGEIAQNSELLLMIELLVCFIVLIVIFVILIFFIKKDIESYHSRIGILKAMGYANAKISIIFAISLSVIVLIAFFTGFFGSIPFQIFLSNYTIYNIGTNTKLFAYNYQVMLFCFLYLPILFSLLIYGISTIAVNKKILFLIYNIEGNQLKLKKERKKVIKNRISKTPFLIRLSFSFVSRTVSKWLLVFFISTFAIFLLLFQFNVNQFNANYLDSQFDFLNPDVKILSGTNIDQMDSLVLNKDKTDSQQYHTYDWVSDTKAKQDLVQDKLQKYDQSIIIPKPRDALIYLFFGISNTPGSSKEEDYKKLKSIFGGVTNLLYLSKNEYLSSSDMKELINLKMYDPSVPSSDPPKIVGVWSWIISNEKEVTDFIHSDEIWSHLTDSQKDSANYALSLFFNTVSQINGYDKTSHGIYPNLYLGNYMTYDSKYEEAVIQKDVQWPESYKGKVFQLTKNLQINGVDTSSVKNFNNFYHLEFKNQKLSDVLTALNKPVNTRTPPSDMVIPVVISKPISMTKNFKINDNIQFRINILNKYININCKIVGISQNDFSSMNIYASYNNLNEFIKQNVYIQEKIPYTVQIPNYYNLLLSKGDFNNDDVLKIFRNINLYSAIENDYNYIKPDIYTPIDSEQSSEDLPLPPSYDLGVLSSGFLNLYSTNISELSAMNSIQSVPLIKNIFSGTLNGLTDQMILAEVSTVVIDIFILFSLISIVFDDNRRIILTLKALGYSSYKVCSSILGFYLLVMIIGFPISSLLVAVIWHFMLKWIFLRTGILLIANFSIKYFLLTVIITLAIIFINLIRGFIAINKEQINVITTIE